MLGSFSSSWIPSRIWNHTTQPCIKPKVQFQAWPGNAPLPTCIHTNMPWRYTCRQLCEDLLLHIMTRTFTYITSYCKSGVTARPQCPNPLTSASRTSTRASAFLYVYASSDLLDGDGWPPVLVFLQDRQTHRAWRVHVGVEYRRLKLAWKESNMPQETGFSTWWTKTQCN